MLTSIVSSSIREIFSDHDQQWLLPDLSSEIDDLVSTLGQDMDGYPVYDLPKTETKSTPNPNAELRPKNSE
jgi:hypothetical protein